MTTKRKRLSEIDDDYPHVVTHLNERWRVILCKHSLQWILQSIGDEALVKPSQERRWHPHHYCVTRKALEGISSASCGPVTQEAAGIIASLPDYAHEERIKDHD